LGVRKIADAVGEGPGPGCSGAVGDDFVQAAE
jgi:hypothetical protein